MQLRSKILASLSLVMGLYVASDYYIVQSTVVEDIHMFERAQAQATTVEVKQGLEGELQILVRRALDWAHADGTAEFIEGTHELFRDSRLGAGVLEREGLDMLYVCDGDGKVLWGEYQDPDSWGGESATAISALVPEGQRLEDSFRTGWRPEDQARGLLRAQSGFLNTELGPLMLASQPVARSAGTGGQCGFVMLGRFLSHELIQDLEARSKAVNISAWFHDEQNASRQEKAYVASFGGEPLIEELDQDWLQVYHLIDARLGALSEQSGESPRLMLRADVSREISRIGEAGARAALVSTLAAGLILMFVLVGLLQRTVLNPISALMHNAVRLGEDDTSDVRFDLERGDEVGVLSREFDNMMEKLAASRAALVDTAREAGKSEIATGILHNVGNVLNSVNVSASMLAKQTEGLVVEDLEALNAIIVEHADDLVGFMTNDPRGQHFQPFLSALTEQLAKGREGIVNELQALDVGIERIRDLVNSQQDFVTRTEVIESCDPSALLERALKVSEGVEAYHSTLIIEREFEDLPRVPLDRYKTLEILVNLVQNARQALEEHASEEQRLTLRVLVSGPDRIRFEVSDNGVGIAPESLTRIFDHGFSTKPLGHGFGLHSSANAATEMNGTLTARSAGLGTGATFMLELPTRVSQHTPAKT